MRVIYQYKPEVVFLLLKPGSAPLRPSYLFFCLFPLFLLPLCPGREHAYARVYADRPASNSTHALSTHRVPDQITPLHLTTPRPYYWVLSDAQEHRESSQAHKHTRFVGTPTCAH